MTNVTPNAAQKPLLNLFDHAPDYDLDWDVVKQADLLDVPNAFGCYAFVTTGRVLYVGSGTAKEVHQYGVKLRIRAHKRNNLIKEPHTRLFIWTCEDNISPLAYEYHTIRAVAPAYNRQNNCTQTKQFNIGVDELARLLAKHGETATIDLLNHRVTDLRAPFPYPSYTLQQALADLKALIRWIPPDKLGWSVVGNTASDYFHYKDRWQTGSSNEHAPTVLWNNQRLRRRLFKSILRYKFKEINAHNLRTVIALSGRVVGQFRPSAMKWLIERFGAKSVLDPCAGWGDRLAGFWASSATRYVGIDPSSARHPCYRNQVIAYSTVVKKDVKLVKMAFEDWKPVEKFDLGFTSPPYWNVETYSSESTQSAVRYPTYASWLDGFMKPFLIIQRDCCKTVCVNVAERIKTPYGYYDLAEDVRMIATSVDLTLVETLGYQIGAVTGGKTVEPILVFRPA